MTATSLLGLTLDQLLATWPDLVVHDDPDEIQEDDTRAYAVHPDGEFEIVFDGSGRADTVFVNRQSPLLEGLVPFSSTRAQVLRRLGEPSRSGEQRVNDYLGPQGAWDRYDSAAHSVHFQYVYGGARLMRVTVMTAAVARRVDSCRG